MRRINRRKPPRHLLGQCRPGSIQPHEVRRKQDCGGITSHCIQRTTQLQACLHHRWWRMPKPSPVQPRLGKMHKGQKTLPPALGLGPSRKTQSQIGLHHTPPGRNQGVQHTAQHPAQATQKWQRQRPKQHQQFQHPATHRDSAVAISGSRTWRLVPGITPKVLRRALANQRLHRSVDLASGLGQIG